MALREAAALTRRIVQRTRMSTTPPAQGLWHPSRGINFCIASKTQFSTFEVSKVVCHGSKDALPTPVNESLAPVCAPQLPTASSDKPVTEASVTEEEEKGEEPETGLVESPPFTPLDYRIPDELFKKAKQAAKDTPESFWTYSLYRRQIEDSDHGAKSEGAGSPAEVKDGDRGSKVKIHYCMSRHTTERVCQYFLNEKLLGFDMEWMPWATKNHGPKENVSLVQISSQSRIALFHVALFQGKDPAELVAPTLRRILEDPDIKKAGVNIKGDCTRLRNNLGIEARGVFELSHLFRLVKYSASGETHLISKKLVNMAAQVEEHLGLAMFKGQDARLSNWMRQLSMQQIIYSASDAYAAVHLFAVMNHKRQQLKPAPPLPYDAELNLPIRLAEEGSVADSSEDDDDEFDSESHTTEGETTVITESFVATVRDTLYIESELQPDAASVPSHDSDGHSRAAKFGRPTPKPRVSNGAASSATAQDSASSASPAARAVDARVAAGDAWATRYQEDRKSQQLQRPVQASRSRLRAYHIWHANDALRPEDIARLLREPPLLTSTVANYILEAILFEKLPFERDRLREQVLSHVPEKVVMSKYRTLAEECRAADASTSTETAPCEETASSG